ncbi:hypothetical protein RFI_06527 [Reticulomyxa filosa]|uniref:phosphatidylserine decarboxylase n=1 Tax=Reticulomyxa filosa TaxID=46433 RepID=X6NZ90_RETFI|nr:hypothetical protein RFI_06527 [Reticulomyxa filosa]|eukprot:ETO30597.1 hypothetical protein RFI_06527 [Reticulomyxa filosa]
MGCCASTQVEQKSNEENQQKGGEENQQNSADTKTNSPEANASEEKKESKNEETSIKAYDRMDNRITVHVIQGRHLEGADASGASDPYVKVTFLSKSNPDQPLEQSRTRVIKKTKNPVWNDGIVCEGIGIISDCQSITLEVWDYDRASKDDFLGAATITGTEVLHDLKKNKQNMRGSALPVWLPLKAKDNKDVGEIQVQVSVIEDANTLVIRDWTHVLELTIGEGIDLGKMPWFNNGHSKPYVRIEWGTQVLHTSKLTNIKNCHWNEKAYIFVHKENNASYYLQITVMDDSAKHEAFGQGVVSAKRIFENKEEEMFEKNVPLSKIQIELDKTLSASNLAAQETAAGECGILTVSAKLHAKDHVQARYYDAMVDHFDTNRNGQLEKEEVQKLLLSLDIPEDPDQFFRKYDEDANDIWSKTEIINMLKDYNFQRSPWMASVLENFLRAGGEATFDAHLMTGVTEPPKIGNERRIIKIKDRRTGLVIQENIPGYVWQALQLMYNSSSGRVFAKQMSSVLTKMSRDKGKEYDQKESAKEIPHFIELHNLDMSIMANKQVEDYATFNDFFARAIDPQSRPLHSPDNENIAVSPADCRLVLFSNIVESSIWVKGSEWTLANLLASRYAEVGEKLEGGSFVIARLAPQDYHRFHWPVSGTVTKITPIDGALYTVNPIAINQPVNVYTENKRCVIEIETGKDRFGLVIMIPIGATLVGSYYLFQKDGTKLEEGHEVRRGDVSGEFRFGGSTVLVLFQKDVVRFDDDLLRHSKEKLETLIQVGDRIGEKTIENSQP